MHIVINGQQIRTFSEEPKDSVMTIIHEILLGIYDSGKAVKSILIDGENKDLDFVTYIDQHFESISNVEIITVDREDISGQFIADLIEYLPRVIRATDSVANLFYGEPDSQAWDYLSELTQSYGHIAQYLRMITSSLMDPKSDELKQQIDSIMKRLETEFKQVESALSNSDLVNLADTIKFEMNDVLKDLLNTLEMSVQQ